MGTPVIPAPSEFKIVSAARLQGAAVSVDGWQVIVRDDTVNWTLWVLPDTEPRVSSSDLDHLLKQQLGLGQVVAQIEATCGGGIDDEQNDSFRAYGSVEQVRAARSAIPYFYDGADSMSRKTLRAIYVRINRWLASRPGATA